MHRSYHGLKTANWHDGLDQRSSFTGTGAPLSSVAKTAVFGDVEGTSISWIGRQAMWCWWLATDGSSVMAQPVGGRNDHSGRDVKWRHLRFPPGPTVRAIA